MRLAIAGLPQTQGSMRAYPGRNGGAFLVQGGSAAAGKRLEDWRRAVADAARREVERTGETYMDGPIGLDAFFGLAKPKSLPKRRYSWPTGARSGDVDKLLRAIFDALTGIVWTDDSQVVTVAVAKAYAEHPGVWLDVHRCDVAFDTAKLVSGG